MTAAEMTGIELGAWFTAGGVGLTAIIKFMTWALEASAKRNTDRRVTLNDMISRQDEDIQELRKLLAAERAEFARQIEALKSRVEAAENARAMMEGVLYRMGWERTDRGTWRRNGDPKTET